MDSAKLDELARKYETEYLATLNNIHWLAYPFLKTGRRFLEIAGCKRAEDPFMNMAMDELATLKID